MRLAQVCRVLLAGMLYVSCTQGVYAAAQDPPPPPTAARQRPNPDALIDMMAAKLDLSDAQKEQIRPIVADRQEKMSALRSDTSMRPMQRGRKMKGIFEESDKKILAVLTEPQKQQYLQMEQQLREQMKERRANGRGGMSSPQ